jgi:nucleotide-binding universal stress UspA family protein
MAGAGSDGVRKIGVAMDYSPSSKKALDWAIANLLHHEDTLVVLHVLHQNHNGDHALWAKSGSRKSKPHPHTRKCCRRLLLTSWFTLRQANRKIFMFSAFFVKLNRFL